MKKLSKSARNSARRTMRLSTAAEIKFLTAIKRLCQIKLPRKATLDDYKKAAKSIDFNKLLPHIKRYVLNILKSNRIGFQDIVKALTRGRSGNKKLQERLDKGFASFVEEQRIYKPLLDKFQNNVKLIKNIPDEVAEHLQEAYEKGVSFRGTDIEKYLTETLGKRAKLIVRTESSKLNSALTEVRARNLNINAYIWSTSVDKRVRPSHKIMDGVLLFWNNVPTLDGMTGHAGEFPNCFPGDELVNLGYGVQKIYRREYAGPLVTVVLNNGTTITATPNHPFLSTSGWKPLNMFDVGEQLFKLRLKNGVSGSNILFSEYDSDENKFTFQQIFTTLEKMGILIRDITGTSTREFHNDGMVDKQIDIIDVNGFLRNDNMSVLFEEIRKFDLTHPKFSILSRLFPTKCPMLQLGNGVFTTTKCSVCRNCVFNILLTRAFGHHKSINFGLCSCLNTILLQNATDNSTTDFEFFTDVTNAKTGIILMDYLIRRQCVVNGVTRTTTSTCFPDDNTLLSQIFTDNIGVCTESLSNLSQRQSIFDIQPLRIVDKFITQSCTHIYNLQSDCGYYTIKENICQHNCRCLGLPVVELDDIQFPVKVAEGNLVIKSKYIKGTHGKGYDVEILSGTIKTYTRAEFLRKFGKMFA